MSGAEFQPQSRLNIKQLVIESPTTPGTVPFDPEREISSSDWEQLVVRREQLRIGVEHVTDLLQLSLSMAYLFPERQPDPAFELEVYEKIKDGLKEMEKEEDITVTELEKELGKLTLLFPEKRTEIMREFSVSARNQEDQLIDALKHEIAQDAYYYGFARRTFFPDATRLSKELYLLLERERSQVEFGNFADFNDRFYMRIIFPQFFAIITDRDYWDAGRASLDQLRKEGAWVIFAKQAFNMKVLAAEKVEVGENGLEIVMPQVKTQLQSTPDLPEQRRF
ncbi:hypothetical protein A3A60_01560 [Candidatus Curtissbacteria bacterium RIFCSPLOWO2_01_FULL_42_26]|uniref:Uncharacterized protein n=1 Tax=Candidatus Curtissbacteria bacterium RIFCSPLOWO2_01_FULL_42_26 TaxID=1797729 RepID=A0A1F5HZK1_9BACT|nr:MAG: hypothetical protein A3A60_01560 [Candidatus Curtissbacteria bacterium RIFCSPLOWO2_01_FULL_42_26]